MKQYTQVVKVAALALLLLLTGSLITGARAQGQVCRDVSQITVCGDTLAAESGTQFQLRGNIKLGTKGGPMVVQATDMRTTLNGLAVDPATYTAQYYHLDAPDPNSGSTDLLFGDVKFIEDPTGLSLMGTDLIVDPTNSQGAITGRLFVDPTAQTIFLPAAGAVPIFNQKGIKRNQADDLSFISQAGALTFFKDGGSVDALALVDGKFNLHDKKFEATLPVDLKLSDAAENPNLRVTMKFTWTSTRTFTGGIDGFKYVMGGLLLDVQGVTVKLPTGSDPATFQAATVKVLKSDNPSLPTLDPTDPTVIFAFTNLKFKNGAWSLGGVEIPIKAWEIGPAFRMTNQTIGIINDTTAGANAQAFQIKSTMQFGAGTDPSKLPVILKIGRALVNNQFKPIFSAGLGAISPKLGTMTFKLTGASFVGDASQDFFGIKADSAVLQWPAHLGGKTAAAIAGFKLGINAARKFQFNIANGTIGLPDFENELFKGSLAGTIGMVNETLTITGVGTLTVKLPGNENSAGVVTTVIMRYNKDADASSSASAAGTSVDPEGNLVQAAQAFQYQPVANTLINKCIAPLGSQTTCPGTTPPPPSPGPKPFEFKLTGFSMKVAGFGLNVTNPKGTDDGGFTTDLIALSLPIGMISSLGNNGSGIQVQGFGIAGDGEVAIQGGGFELAPISVGSVQFVGLKGNFVRKPDKSYEFTAAGKLPLPGIEPGTNNGGIGVSITVRLAQSGNFNGVGVVVDFGSPPLPPIPIGSTGMNLTKVTGSFDLNNQTVTIGMTLTATSKFKIPLGALGSLPIATAKGGVSAKFNPFLFSGNLSLSVLIFQVATASVNIGDGQGFNGGDGMNVNATVNAVIVTGNFKMRIGKGVPSDPEKRRFAASATWILGIPANTYGVGRPPFNLGGINVSLSGGVFTDNNKNPAAEALGVKASVCGPNGNLCIGFFINLGEDIGNGDFLDFTNIEKYVLIPASVARAYAAAGRVGYASVAMTPRQAQEQGLVVSAAQINSGAAIQQDTIPIEVTSTTTLLAGINFHSGSPVISLKLPNSTVLTKDTVNGSTQTYLSQTVAITNGGANLLFTISGATPGTYQLIIDNAPAEYDNVSYTLNSSPHISMTEPTCIGPNVAGITVTCNVPIGLAVTADQPASPDANSKVKVSWNSSDADSPDATVSIGYVKDLGAAELVDFADINFVAEDLPVGAGSKDIDFSEVGTGGYRPVVVIDDHQNGVVLATSATTITVVDHLPPAIPTGLTSVPGAGELLVKWNQNGEQDLAGYEIGFGLVNDPNQFLYTRLMGPKEIVTGTNSIVDAKLWGLADDTTVFFGLRAYDTSGNYSDWTPLQSAKPWAISPVTWNPVPNGENSGNVEVAFDSPMTAASLEKALSIKDANGKPLAGDTYFLVNAAGDKIIGVGVSFKEAYEGKASAVLLGGSNGAKAEDGRTMGANYAWSFILHHASQQSALFIPVISNSK